MAIISQIGRKHPRVRALLVGLYAVLLLGAVSMVYPFLLMLSGSTKSAVDLKQFDAIPRFLHDDDMLYRKHAEALFNESIDLMNATYDTDFPSFESVQPPPRANPVLLREWRAFLQEHPLSPPEHACGYVYTPLSRTIPYNLRAFRKELEAAHGGSIEEMNRALESSFAGWNSFFVLPENYLPRMNKPVQTPFMSAFWDFKARTPPWMLFAFSVEGFYKKMFLKTQYTRDIAEYNRLHGTRYASYQDVRLSRTIPAGTPQERQDWELFVRHTLNLLWIRAAPAARPAYQRFLKAKYGTLEQVNRVYGSRWASLEEIPLMENVPAEGLPHSDWESFISGWRDPDTQELHLLAAEHLRIHSVETLFQDVLQQRHGTVSALNQAAGTTYAGFHEIQPPQAAAQYEDFLQHRIFLRKHFVIRNYLAVLDYMVVHGRGVWNTLIYCSLAVFFALLVNPLAAYAMSRYRMPSAYKILLFLMLTMAFPPMVTQIPVFIMLREMNLLNTFAALLLPGLANGYSIFLLKGFFDSLPRELYETAELDGAGEWTMFWQITMRLSTPILSVVALAAFSAAYANFMFALLICQDEKMWTLMVWLYELQQRSGQAVLYASLILAAIPTFIIFILCQRVILRGIVVPVEK